MVERHRRTDMPPEFETVRFRCEDGRRQTASQSSAKIEAKP